MRGLEEHRPATHRGVSIPRSLRRGVGVGLYNYPLQLSRAMFKEVITFERLEVQRRRRAPRAFQFDRPQLSGGVLRTPRTAVCRDVSSSGRRAPTSSLIRLAITLPLSIDLRRATYEEFVTFVFDHYPEDDVDNFWYWKLEGDVEIDPRRAVEYITRVCEQSVALLDTYTIPQIAQGINYLLGAGNRDGFLDLLWDPDVPWPERYRCIRAIPRLYTHVFERDPDGAGGLAYMLWDPIAYDYFCGTRDPATNPEDARVQDAMFEALTGMLASDDRETLAGAIHGLGHLRHRQSNQAIRDLLSSGRELDPELRSYAAAVLEDQFQ